MNIWRNFRKILRQIIAAWHLDLFPVRRAIAGYNVADARGDLKASVNVALLAFPQGMAYALIADLPISYGLFGSAVASILGGLFGGSRFVALGPTNATAVLLFTTFLTLEVTAAEKLAMMPLLLSMVGLFLMVGAMLKVANLIQYVSRTVVTGYITAAAFYIILNQIRKVAGISFEIPDGATFLGLIRLTVENLGHSHLPSVVLAAITAALFYFMRWKFRMLPNVAITLVVMSVAAYGINSIVAPHPEWGETFGGSIRMLNAVDATTWGFTLPRLNSEWLNLLAKAALIIAFLSILEGASIGKSLAARAGERLDTNQEMFGMGMANLGCAFLSGMPASGSLTRSQLNCDSGARTPLAVVYCGIMLAVGAFVVGPFIKYIPEPALGVLIIGIGLSLINAHHIKIVTKTTQSDAIVFVTTAIAALLVGLDFAIILGTATSILLFLRKAAVPELIEYQADEDTGQLTPLDANERRDPEVSIVHVEGDLFFGAAELFRDQMRRVMEDPNLKIVVLKMRNAHHLDATSVLELEELVNSMNQHDRFLLISEARKDVVRIFKNSGLRDVIGRENIFIDDLSNPVISTAKALKRAQSLLGNETARVSIYVDEKKSD